MMGQGLSFGIEGPNMEGTWYNPATGDSFTVRNSFFEDNQYLVQTTDGRILGYNQIQNYIKSDSPVVAPQKPKPVKNELPTEVADLLEDTTDIQDEISELISPKTPSLVNLATSQFTPDTNYNTVPNKSIDNLVIEKALSKCSLPDIQVGISWDNFPKAESEMLCKLMDVDVEDIIKYYVNQVDVNTTTLLIHEVIRDYVTNQLLSGFPVPIPEVVEADPMDGGPLAKESKEPKKMGGPKATKAGRKATNKKK